MADRVKGKVALITGGGSGIGRATAMLFAAEGARVVIADYNVEGGERTLRAIKEARGDGIFHGADVANPKEVEALVAKPSRPTADSTPRSTTPESMASSRPHRNAHWRIGSA
jgi:NAD(P)-dependent dehydrogenase (short-subunit alcohol dehydrogenase family)